MLSGGNEFFRDKSTIVLLPFTVLLIILCDPVKVFQRKIPILWALLRGFQFCEKNVPMQNI